MKTRIDFVSNSSSSSYVFSINFKKYDFEEFVKNVCAQCDSGYSSGKRKKPQDLDLYGKNEAILKYCMRYFELLHLGRIRLNRERKTIKREKNKNPDDLGEYYSEFNIVKRELIDNAPNSEYNEENAKARMVSADEIEYEHDVLSEAGITVNKMFMENSVRRDWWNAGASNRAKQRKERVDRILQVVRCAMGVSDVWRTPNMAKTYLITKSTIANTRDLIAAGYDVLLEKWEDIDALEARLRAGETIFCAECGDSGEGEDDTRVFSMNSQYPFKDMPLECITSEGL